MSSVITRFAPSPSGDLHLGGARTALFCYLFSRHCGGKFILRIEDTDKSRSKEEHTEEILAALNWLKLEWDEGPVRQSSRLANYAQAAQTLLDKGLAYRCICTPQELEEMRDKQMQRGEKPKYDRRHRDADLGVDTNDYVIRFKNPLEGASAFTDLIKGDIKVDNSELDDMIIVRQDGSPTYNFCAVVDDIAMGITHIIRGDDHLLNSVRQCNLYHALTPSSPLPEFAHLPLILNQDGGRLSKREGANNVLNYRDMGILPDALCSYMARLGWSHGDQEVFTRSELVSLFNIENIHKSAAHYDESKMLWINHNFIKEADNLSKEIEKYLMDLNIVVKSSPPLDVVINLHKERVDNLKDLAAEITFYYKTLTEYDKNSFTEYANDTSIECLKILEKKFLVIDTWDSESIKHTIKETVKEKGVKFPVVGMPLRLALTGCNNSPSVDKVAEILGKDETVGRLNRLISEFTEKVQSA